MMKKHTIIGLGLILQVLSVLKGNTMGPIPLPFAGQSYSNVPVYRMTSAQQIAVQQAFTEAQNAFRQNHTLCSTRGDCLKLDLTTLQSFINSNLKHPARPLFQNVANIIRNDARRQVFTTQWVIFKNLSLQRQNEYRGGLRIIPFQPQMAKVRWGATWITAPAHYNQDDVFTALLQEISHRHRSCDEYIHCLSMDLQIINAFYKRLAPSDPMRPVLARLSQIIKNLSNKTIFNTNFYLSLYNPLSPDWFDAMKKHKAKNLTAYGHKEWQQVEANRRTIRWFSPRPTNGQIITQSLTQQKHLFQSMPTPPNQQNPNEFQRWMNFVRGIF